MKNTKTEFRYYSIADWAKEEAYLRKRHKQGWKFVKVNPFGVYHFEKCQPEDVIYRLDYNQEVLKNIKNKADYIQMFIDCGWDYLQECNGYTYFRKPAAEAGDDEEIFSDDESKMDMIYRVYKGRLVPMLIVIFACIIPQMILQQANHRTGMVIVFVLFLILYIWIFIRFGMTYWKIKKMMKDKF